MQERLENIEHLECLSTNSFCYKWRVDIKIDIAPPLNYCAKLCYKAGDVKPHQRNRSCAKEV